MEETFYNFLYHKEHVSNPVKPINDILKFQINLNRKRGGGQASVENSPKFIDISTLVSYLKLSPVEVNYENMMNN